MQTKVYYLVLKITNKINRRFYIAYHQTESPKDDYMGSGFVLKKAKEKYGIQNFSKRIISKHRTSKAAFAKERSLIAKYLSNPKTKSRCYNIAAGGQGGNMKLGFSRKQWKVFARKMSKVHKGKIISNEMREKISKANKGKIVSDDTKKKMSLAQGGRKHWLYDKHHTKETRKKMSLSHKGLKTSEETKQKISLANKGKQLSETQRIKISRALKGRRLSEETKRKMSKAKKKYWHENNKELF